VYISADVPPQLPPPRQSRAQSSMMAVTPQEGDHERTLLVKQVKLNVWSTWDVKSLFKLIIEFYAYVFYVSLCLCIIVIWTNDWRAAVESLSHLQAMNFKQCFVWVCWIELFTIQSLSLSLADLSIGISFDTSFIVCIPQVVYCLHARRSIRSNFKIAVRKYVK
jgi:hypothetical protein